MSSPVPLPSVVGDTDVVSFIFNRDPIRRQDAWIAATALYLDLPSLSHNYRHYAHVPGLHVITEPDP